MQSLPYTVWNMESNITPSTKPGDGPVLSAQSEIDFFWEDFVVGDVRIFGQHRMTEDEILKFAHQFDPQRFHTDPQWAQQSLYQGLIASGWHTCSVAMRLMVDKYVGKSASLGSPGVDNVRWLKPVRAGDTVTYRRITLAVRPSASKPGVGVIQSRWEGYNQHGEKVMSMEGWSLRISSA